MTFCRHIILPVLFTVYGLMPVASVTADSAGALAQGFCSRPTLSVAEPPPPYKVRLGISRKVVAPGGRINIRVENLGSEPVTYGYLYRLARYENGSWKNLPTGPFFAPKLYLGAGTAGTCQEIREIRIAAKAVAGTYRVTKKVSPAESGHDGQTTVRATFRVH